MANIETRVRRQKGKAVVRAIHEAALEDAGAKRSAALERADQQLDRIARLLPEALKAGIGMTEIGRLTGVSRPTLYELRGRYGESALDLRLAVMHALLSPDTAFPEDLASYLGRSDEEVQGVVQDFLSRGWVEWDVSHWRSVEPVSDAPSGTVWVVDDDDKRSYALSVTSDGIEALESWKLTDEDGAAR